MKRFCIILTLTVYACIGLSNTDSLLQVLVIAKEDTAKVTLLRIIAWKYTLINPDSSLMFYKQALDLSRKLNDHRALILSLVNLASAYNRIGDLENNYKLSKEALDLATTWKDEPLMGFAYSRMASYYSSENHKPDSALYYYALAEKSRDASQMEYEKWNIYFSRGELYYTLGMLDKSEADLLKALEITSKKKIRMHYGSVLYRIVRNYFDQGNWEKYSKYSEEYFRFLNEGKRVKEINNFSHRGLYFFEDDADPAKVIPVLENIVRVNEQRNNVFGTIDALQYLAQIQLKANRVTDAIKNLEKAAEVARKNNYPVKQEVNYHKLYKIYEGLDNEAMEYFYYKKFKEIQDTVEVLDGRRNFEELEVKYETEKKEEALARQGLELEKQKLSKRNLLLISALLSVIALATLFFLYTKSKANKLLAGKNEIIAKSLGEKELLLREIHHRVKNNLQVISSLLNLQSKFIEDIKAKEAIKEGRNRVNSMSIIHQNLYMHDNLVTIGVELYLQQLSDSLFQSYNINPDKIKLTTDVDPMELDVDTIVPLGLIMNELISNALKHAFPGNRQGEVSIQLKNTNGSMLLEVRDNGIGMAGHELEGSPRSFGMEMIRAFAQKLKASIEIKSDAGTRVTMIIPKQAA